MTTHSAARYSVAPHRTNKEHYVPLNTMQHHTAQWLLHSATRHFSVQHGTAQHGTAQRSTAQDGTAPHRKASAPYTTGQHGTAQRSTVHAAQRSAA
jgi:hypothetical protein